MLLIEWNILICWYFIYKSKREDYILIDPGIFILGLHPKDNMYAKSEPIVMDMSLAGEKIKHNVLEKANRPNVTLG